MTTRPDLRLSWLWHAVGAVMIVFIMVMSLSPSNSPVLVFNVWDKLLHFTGYAAVGAWYAMVLTRSSLIRSGCALIVLGCALEIAQGFVPGRTTELLDAVANILGAVAGTALGFTLWHAGIRFFEQTVLRLDPR